MRTLIVFLITSFTITASVNGQPTSPSNQQPNTLPTPNYQNNDYNIPLLSTAISSSANPSAAISQSPALRTVYNQNVAETNPVLSSPLVNTLQLPQTSANQLINSNGLSNTLNELQLHSELGSAAPAHGTSAQTVSMNVSPLRQLSQDIGLTDLIQSMTQALRNLKSTPARQTTSQVTSQFSNPAVTNQAQLTSAPITNSVSANILGKQPQSTNSDSLTTVDKNAIQNVQSSQFSTQQARTALTPLRTGYTRPIQLRTNIAQPNRNLHGLSSQSNSASTSQDNNNQLTVQYEGIPSAVGLDIPLQPTFIQQDAALRQQYINNPNSVSLNLGSNSNQIGGLRSAPYPMPQIPTPQPSIPQTQEMLTRQRQMIQATLNNIRQLPTQQLTAVMTNGNVP